MVVQEAEAEAAAILQEAEVAAAAELERARAEAEEMRRHAREEGRRAGEVENARAQALARRRARTVVLAARRESYETLRAQARVGALALRGSPRYPALLDRLAAAARSQLGGEAELELDPREVGGVRARAAGRSVDYTLVLLVDRCVDALGGRLEELWR
jgi:vacuolar-type H+-ATPase subunit E/Vma4